MAKRKAKQKQTNSITQPTHATAQVVAKSDANQSITGFAWDGTMDQIHQNIPQKDWPKFQKFDNYMEIHNDQDVDLVDDGDYVLHDQKTNHYSSCSPAKYKRDYA